MTITIGSAPVSLVEGAPYNLLVPLRGGRIRLEGTAAIATRIRLRSIGGCGWARSFTQFTIACSKTSNGSWNPGDAHGRRLI